MRARLRRSPGCATRFLCHWPGAGRMSREFVAFIDESRCIGCAQCLPPCPVDCIRMVPASRPWTTADAEAARQRARRRRARVSAQGLPMDSVSGEAARAQRRAAVAAALARSRARKGHAG